MKKNIEILLILTIFCLFSPSAGAQTDSTSLDEATEIIKDSVSFSYKFFPKDTLFYRIESKDSVIVDYGEPLIRIRTERIRVVCDSVSEGKFYHLRISMTDFVAEETQGTEKGIQRESSPWLGRETGLTIDSIGSRLHGWVDNPNKAALSPGGSWTPYLFFKFGATRKAVNESWLVSATDTLYENGVPSANLKNSSLLRAMEDIDTLGYESSQFRFVRTGRGDIELITKDDKLINSVVVNSGGRIIISKQYQVPIYLFQTIEQKLKIYMPDSNPITAQHFTNTNFVLEEIRRQQINKLGE